MRQLGKLTDETHAKQLVAHLVAKRLELRLDHDADSGENHWTIWILSEDDLPEAKKLWDTFHHHPEQLPELTTALTTEPSEIPESKNAAQSESVTQTQLSRSEEEPDTASSLEPSPANEPPSPTFTANNADRAVPPTIKLGSIRVTAVFTLLSVLISLVSHFSSPRGNSDLTQITLEQRTFKSLSLVDPDWYAASTDAFASVKQGEAWRLITSAFLHADPLHLAFNVVWFFFLGSAIERIDGSLNLLKIIAISHFIGLVFQVSLPVESSWPLSLQGSPFSLGVSGAVYGMFGYLWLRPQFTPDYPVFLVRSNLILMIGWLVICVTPMADTVPNGAQLGGLLSGIALAWSASKQQRLG
ncbi:MAG: rhomboid family intramembrane serine protease [Rubripirellula sp.]